MKLHNIRLLVNDFDKCFTFYKDTLGLTCTWGKLGDNYASFNIGLESGLAIFKAELMSAAFGKDESAKSSVSNDKFAIVAEVKNVDELYLELQKKGIRFLNQPMDMPGWGIRVVHFRDPENNLIEIYTELPKEKWDQHLIKDEKEFNQNNS
jgi:catechol 2,3-dioxygenase-like lactoylglutathione lyase family enzyme